jgi:hypothetical protein
VLSFELSDWAKAFPDAKPIKAMVMINFFIAAVLVLKPKELVLKS